MADAQATQGMPLRPAPQAPDAWPADAAAWAGLDLLVVTVADPGHRHRCREPQIERESIVCGKRRGTVYSRQEVAALILPGSHEGVPPLADFGAGMLFLATGLVFLVAISAVAAVCLGALAVLSSIKAGRTKVGIDGPDVLLYLKPGERLSVPLRWVPRQAAASAGS